MAAKLPVFEQINFRLTNQSLGWLPVVSFGHWDFGLELFLKNRSS
jgi:hypothetical protein